MNHLFHEGEGLPIYEYNGRFFYDGKDTPIEFETKDAKIETKDFMSFRRSIGVGNYNRDPYLPIFDEHATNYRNGAFDSDDGYLPDFIYNLYKEITDESLFGHNYVVWDKETDKRFCVRQVCSLCEHYESCNPILTKIQEPRPMTVVSLDVSAQEPLLLSYRSKEPNWVNTFALKHLKKSGTIDYLQPMFGKKYNMDFTNTSIVAPFENYYQFFAQFDWNTDRLVYINTLISGYISTKIYSDELDNELSKIFKDYEDFVAKREGRM